MINAQATEARPRPTQPGCRLHTKINDNLSTISQQCGNVVSTIRVEFFPAFVFLSQQKEEKCLSFVKFYTKTRQMTNCLKFEENLSLFCFCRDKIQATKDQRQIV